MVNGSLCDDETAKARPFGEGHFICQTHEVSFQSDPQLIARIQDAVAFLDASAAMLERGEMQAAGSTYAETWRAAHQTLLEAFRAGREGQLALPVDSPADLEGKIERARREAVLRVERAVLQQAALDALKLETEA